MPASPPPAPPPSASPPPAADAEPVRIGPRIFRFGSRTYIMGVLNVTPDSFSDGGRWLDPGLAVARARQMVAEGADIIDVGAESASIAASKPELDEELRRLLPVVRAIASELDVVVSVDTYKAAVAEAVLAAGAHLINDISGLHADPDLARVVAAHGAGLVVMHMQGHPRAVARQPRYGADVLADVCAWLREGLEHAAAAGVDLRRVFVDPGIGVGKLTEHNLELLRRLGELRQLGQPVLLGASRTSVIGNILELPVHDRLEGTLATTAWAVVQGADAVRVHDVRANARVARMMDALVRGWQRPADGWAFDAVTGRALRPLRPVGGTGQSPAG